MAGSNDLIVGIDEAGRGPVIGNMFIVCLGVNEDYLGELIELGVKDSKKLSPKKRSALTPKISRLAKVIIIESVKPEYIDKHNINAIFAQFVIKSLETILAAGLRIKHVYVDAVSGRKFRDVIAKYLLTRNYDIPVSIEPKADERYPIVAAASIIAKYLRDSHVRKLHEVYGDFGSGYPSDPKTIEWLSKYSSESKLPPIIRKSWSTLKKLGILKEEGKGLEKWLK
ncbi:MAG: ribonuclease HII [Desulfurococcales archaeon]|nr:ribonuclease HII [Desulfurococcales archaeon]